jgi:cytochrome c-type biogenesis protein CcmH
MRTFILIFIALMITAFQVYAADDFYHFDSQETKTRFQQLTSSLRCLVCQNQNLSESNAPLANDLRAQVYQKIESGQSDQEIINYLVARYGDFILYKPPFSLATALLWMGPLLFLLCGIAYLFFYLRSHRMSTDVC